MEGSQILKCAKVGCENLHNRILSAQKSAGLKRIGIKRYLNERLFQHETAIEIMRQMNYDVDVDVDEIESNKNVDFILKTGNKIEFVGECKVWKSTSGEAEFKEKSGIAYELNILERVKSAKIFYLIYTIDTLCNQNDNIRFLGCSLNFRQPFCQF